MEEVKYNFVYYNALKEEDIWNTFYATFFYYINIIITENKVSAIGKKMIEFTLFVFNIMPSAIVGTKEHVGSKTRAIKAVHGNNIESYEMNPSLLP